MRQVSSALNCSPLCCGPHVRLVSLLLEVVQVDSVARPEAVVTHVRPLDLVVDVLVLEFVSNEACGGSGTDHILSQAEVNIVDNVVVEF